MLHNTDKISKNQVWREACSPKDLFDESAPLLKSDKTRIVEPPSYAASEQDDVTYLLKRDGVVASSTALNAKALKNAITTHSSIAHSENGGGDPNQTHEDVAAEKWELSSGWRRNEAMHRLCTNLNIKAHVEYFSESSHPSDSLTVQKSQPAYRVYDDYMKNKYIFVRKIASEGERVTLIFETPGLLSIQSSVQKIDVRIGARNYYHQIPFTQERGGMDGRQESVCVHVALPTTDALLNLPSPFWGSVENKYVPLNFLITVRFVEAESKFEGTETFIKTIYCHVRKNTGMWTRFLSQCGKWIYRDD